MSKDGPIYHGWTPPPNPKNRKKIIFSGVTIFWANAKTRAWYKAFGKQTIARDGEIVSIGYFYKDVLYIDETMITLPTTKPYKESVKEAYIKLYKIKQMSIVATKKSVEEVKKAKYAFDNSPSEEAKTTLKMAIEEHEKVVDFYDVKIELYNSELMDEIQKIIPVTTNLIQVLGNVMEQLDTKFDGGYFENLCTKVARFVTDAIKNQQDIRRILEEKTGEISTSKIMTWTTSPGISHIGDHKIYSHDGLDFILSRFKPRIDFMTMYMNALFRDNKKDFPEALEMNTQKGHRRQKSQHFSIPGEEFNKYSILDLPSDKGGKNEETPGATYGDESEHIPPCSPCTADCLGEKGDQDEDISSSVGFWLGSSAEYWNTYSYLDNFDDIFEIKMFGDNPNGSLLYVLRSNDKFGRESIASLLNAGRYKEFPFTTKEILSMVADAKPEERENFTCFLNKINNSVHDADKGVAETATHFDVFHVLSLVDSKTQQVLAFSNSFMKYEFHEARITSKHYDINKLNVYVNIKNAYGVISLIRNVVTGINNNINDDVLSADKGKGRKIFPLVWVDDKLKAALEKDYTAVKQKKKCKHKCKHHHRKNAKLLSAIPEIIDLNEKELTKRIHVPDV